MFRSNFNMSDQILFWSDILSGQFLNVISGSELCRLPRKLSNAKFKLSNSTFNCLVRSLLHAPLYGSLLFNNIYDMHVSSYVHMQCKYSWRDGWCRIIILGACIKLYLLVVKSESDENKMFANSLPNWSLTFFLPNLGSLYQALLNYLYVLAICKRK